MGAGSSAGGPLAGGPCAGSPRAEPPAVGAIPRRESFVRFGDLPGGGGEHAGHTSLAETPAASHDASREVSSRDDEDDNVADAAPEAENSGSISTEQSSLSRERSSLSGGRGSSISGSGSGMTLDTRLGSMRCLSALGEWEELCRLASSTWR